MKKKMKSAPTNLDELIEAVEKYFHPRNISIESCAWEVNRYTPPWKGAKMAHGELDMTSLPTFGGTEPSDTTGVWSWDETRMMVGEAFIELEIIEREEN